MSRRTLPIRLAPLPGEALDSWFEATAYSLRTPLTHLLPQLGLSPRRSRSNRTADIPTDWTVLLRPAEADAVAAATGTAPDRLAAMTLDRYNHRAVEIDTATRRVMRQVLWGRARGSRFCPDCLRDNGGRWPLSWRLGWTFACTTHQRLLADLCPHCGHIPRQHSHPVHVIPQQGLCAAPLATNGKRSTSACCHAPLTTAESWHLGPDHPALLAQLALDEIIASVTIRSGIYTGRPQPVRTVLADMHSVAVRALNAPSLSNLVGFVPADLLDAYEGVRALKPGQSAIADPPKRLGFMTPPSAITTAVSLTAAVRVLATNDVQEAAETMRQFLPTVRKFHGQLSPTKIDRWGHACSPVIKSVRLAAVGPLLRPTDQLRYRVASSFPGQPTSTDCVSERHRFVPTMFWPTWSLLLQPGTGLLPRVMRRPCPLHSCSSAAAWTTPMPPGSSPTATGATSVTSSSRCSATHSGEPSPPPSCGWLITSTHTSPRSTTGADGDSTTRTCCPGKCGTPPAETRGCSLAGRSAANSPALSCSSA